MAVAVIIFLCGIFEDKQQVTVPTENMEGSEAEINITNIGEMNFDLMERGEFE